MGVVLWVPEPQWSRAGPFRPALPFPGLVLAQGRAGTAHHSAVIIAKDRWRSASPPTGPTVSLAFTLQGKYPNCLIAAWKQSSEHAREAMLWY